MVDGCRVLALPDIVDHVEHDANSLIPNELVVSLRVGFESSFRTAMLRTEAHFGERRGANLPISFPLLHDGEYDLDYLRVRGMHLSFRTDYVLPKDSEDLRQQLSGR